MSPRTVPQKSYAFFTGKPFIVVFSILIEKKKAVTVQLFLLEVNAILRKTTSVTMSYVTMSRQATCDESWRKLRPLNCGYNYILRMIVFFSARMRTIRLRTFLEVYKTILQKSSFLSLSHYVWVYHSVHFLSFLTQSHTIF